GMESGAPRRHPSIEGEGRIGGAARKPAPVGEEVLTHGRSIHGFQEARRDDLIGIDILRRESDSVRSQAIESGHLLQLTDNNVRASVTLPRTAEAAAVRGEARNVRPSGPCRPSKLR